MGVSRFIARHPYIVIGVWLLIAVAAAPLFAKLNTVVQTMQHMLPPNTESSKADELLNALKSGDPSPTIIIVRGVRVDDNDTLLRLIRWARVYNESFYSEGLGSNLQSVPLILASINETIYSKLVEGLEKGAGGARKGYEAIARLNETFHEAYRNVSSMISRARELVKGIMEADRGYAEAYRGLLMLTDAAVKVKEGLTRIDSAAVNATDQLLGLASMLRESAGRIALLDRQASMLAENLTRAAAMLEGVLRNDTLAERMEELVAFMWWQATRTYYYMSVAHGNYTLYAMYTNLSFINERLAPLPEDVAKLVWLNMTRMVEKGVPPDDAGIAVAEVLARRIVAEYDPRAVKLLPVYVEAFRDSLEALKREEGVSNLTSLYSPVPGEEAVKSQLRVLEFARAAASSAALTVVQRADEITVKLLAEKLAALGVDNATAVRVAESIVRGEVDAEAVARAVLELAEARGYSLPEGVAERLPRVIASLDPRLEGRIAGNWSLAVRAAAMIAGEMGAPREVVALVEPLVARNVTGRAAYARIAYRIVAEKVSKIMPEAAQLVPIVEKYDPEARGLLLRDPGLLKQAILEVLAARGGERLKMLPRDVLEAIVERVVRGSPPSSEELRSIALRLVEERVSRLAGGEAARVIVEVLERYDPEARGVIAENETLAALIVAEEAAARAGGKLPVSKDVLARLLLHPEELNETFCSMFREEALKRAPSEARSLVEKAVDLLCREWGITAEKAWELVAEAVSNETRRMVSRFEFDGFEPPAWLAEEVARYTVLVARNETSVEAAAARLATRLVLESVAPRVLEETRGLMVAKDYNGFIVMFEASGSSLEERVEKAKRAWSLLNETLGRFIGGFESMMTGADVISKEVREYALHDMEKTSKISETVTFLVLLLILESVFAVIMPYIGIGLGIVLGGALVYLAAKQGLIDVTNEAQTLMITTALGLGADYAGYLVHRFREEYALFKDSRVAAERALSRAGPAIVASALTVIIGFASLLLGWDLAFLRSLGETIPVTVAATALASLTLVPALLAVLGGRRWFWWPREPRPERHVGRESRLMKWLIRHHWLVITAFVLLFAVAGYYYVNFKGSHDMKLMLPENAEAVKAFEVLKEEYMPGLTDPLFAVVKLHESWWESSEARSLVKGLAERLEGVEGVGKVFAPSPNQTMGLVSKDGRIVALRIILSVDPYSREGEETIREVHRILHEYCEEHGVEGYLGGLPYAMLEMDELLHDRFYTRILPAASLLMLLVFTVIFGSLPVSIAALAVIIGAAMTGIMASVALFQWLMGKPILWFLHVVTLVAVLGVGMDYNSFFLARALEECRKHACDVEKALPKAAGAVSLFVFGLAAVVSSAYLSLLASSNVGMREMGFTLGFTILLAGAMAAYLFTPLVVALLGERAWWPHGMRKRIEH